jgi:hypothetical protein
MDQQIGGEAGLLAHLFEKILFHRVFHWDRTSGGYGILSTVDGRLTL